MTGRREKSNRTPKEEERDVSRQSSLWALAAAGVLALSGGVAACGGDDDDNGGGGGGGGGSKPKVAVLLPDSKSSVRWETVDRPLLQKALETGGTDPTITNAEGDKSTQQQQAEQAITNGAKVILLVNLDSGSGAAIAANAKSQGVKVIDYDRLTLDTDAQDYYVSFDNEKVGKLQGQGLVDCLGDKKGARIAELNGSPTDNNATLFKNGYDSVLKPKYDSGDFVLVDDQSVPDWDNQKALTIFEQILQKADNKVDGVLAANDGLGNAAISALKQRKLPQIPVTGQDATLEGLQNIVNGDQCMTVYKAIEKEADAAAGLAIALAKGEKPSVDTVPIDNGTHNVPSVLETPVSVTKDNISQYFGNPDYPTKEDICAGNLKAKCDALGL
jgi:D-xylose transport system substrate-binding protein